MDRQTSPSKKRLASVKEALANGETEQAARLLRDDVSSEQDFRTCTQQVHALGKIPREDRGCVASYKLAVLGGATTDYLAPVLELFAFARRIDLHVYQSLYGAFEQEALSPSQALVDFEPDFVHFHCGLRNLAPASADESAEERVGREVKRFTTLFETIASSMSCPVLVNNFETPCERPLGNLEAQLAISETSFVQEVNRRLALALPPGVHLHDIDALSSYVGKKNWSSPELWHRSKSALAFGSIAQYAHSLGSLLCAVIGQSKKCLVLDLDNTLWGGVIGDDGLEGIALGPDSMEGEAFSEFQAYLLRLMKQGIILAVCSKNDHETAMLPFREHPHMLIREEHISCFVANWNRKDDNIRYIAETLNIGMDAMVFFDDNPAERALVSDSLPMLTVVDVPTSPSQFVRALDGKRLFESAALTQEDSERTAHYKATVARSEAQRTTKDYDAYLSGLEMIATIAPLNAQTLARTTQLVNKTNQFNLTTRRHSEATLRSFMESDTHECYTCTVSDRFGAMGLISVLSATIENDQAVIDTWLMSCRAFSRRIEFAFFGHFADMLRKRGVKTLVGCYSPTPRNEIVRDIYATMGFKSLGTNREDVFEWILKGTDKITLPAIGHIQCRGEASFDQKNNS